MTPTPDPTPTPTDPAISPSERMVLVPLSALPNIEGFYLTQRVLVTAPGYEGAATVADVTTFTRKNGWVPPTIGVRRDDPLPAGHADAGVDILYFEVPELQAQPQPAAAAPAGLELLKAQWEKQYQEALAAQKRHGEKDTTTEFDYWSGVAVAYGSVLADIHDEQRRTLLATPAPQAQAEAGAGVGVIWPATSRRCLAGSDGDCNWPQCPQERDNEPHATGRDCPLDNRTGEEW